MAGGRNDGRAGNTARWDLADRAVGPHRAGTAAPGGEPPPYAPLRGASHATGCGTVSRHLGTAHEGGRGALKRDGHLTLSGSHPRGVGRRTLPAASQCEGRALRCVAEAARRGGERVAQRGSNPRLRAWIPQGDTEPSRGLGGSHPRGAGRWNRAASRRARSGCPAAWRCYKSEPRGGGGRTLRHAGAARGGERASRRGVAVSRPRGRTHAAARG